MKQVKIQLVIFDRVFEPVSDPIMNVKVAARKWQKAHRTPEKADFA